MAWSSPVALELQLGWADEQLPKPISITGMILALLGRASEALLSFDTAIHLASDSAIDRATVLYHKADALLNLPDVRPDNQSVPHVALSANSFCKNYTIKYDWALSYIIL